MIDLHVHSSASDGTLSPECVACRGRDLALMALTDHDSTEGVARFLAESRRLGVTAPRLAGAELSVEPGEGYHQFHLLGLGFDIANAPLQDLLREIREILDDRNRRMYAKLAEIGMPVDEADVRRHVDGVVVKKPHFAHALKDRGWVANYQEAFDRVLGDGCPADIPHRHVKPEDAVERIHAAGGIAVLAHPFSWTKDPQALRQGLVRLKDIGVDGIEAHYQAYSAEQRRFLLSLAHELDFLVTAGSDYHGDNKPDIQLGMGVPDESAFINAITGRLSAERCSAIQKETENGKRS